MSTHREQKSLVLCCIFFFFFNDTATTEIYTLSLHDALPICSAKAQPELSIRASATAAELASLAFADRKSTRLNSSHANISYAVFFLKKKASYLFGIQDFKQRTLIPFARNVSRRA